jgi:hypothetical protein
MLWCLVSYRALSFVILKQKEPAEVIHLGIH